MHTPRALLLTLAVTVLPASALAESYTFAVPEKFINLTFESRMDIEDILGSTNSLTGTLQKDAQGLWNYRLEVPVASLKTGIALRDEHLRSPGWLDAEKFPTLVFEGKTAKSLGKGRFELAGTFTLRGQSKPLKLVVETQAIPKAQAEKAGLGPENWLRVRGQFTLKLSDFGVKIPDMAVAKVNDLWTVKLSVFAKEVAAP